MFSFTEKENDQSSKITQISEDKKTLYMRLNEDLEKGIEQYDKVVESEDSNEEKLGKELQEVHDNFFKKIINEANKSDKLYKMAIFYRSKILFLQKNIADAMGDLDYLLRISHDDISMQACAHGAQGIILYTIEHFEDALYSFQKAFNLGSEDARSYIEDCERAIRINKSKSNP